MYSAHICSAALALAENMRNAQIPMYGQHLRLPSRSASITILNDLRRLMFPAYFGDEELMALEPENYAALLIERIEKQLAAQIALAVATGDQLLFLHELERGVRAPSGGEHWRDLWLRAAHRPV